MDFFVKHHLINPRQHGFVTARSNHVVGSTDYCPAEYFNVSCSAGRVLLMQSAQYGRMAPGRCVGFGYGHIGCSVNVLTYMHARCTARTRCVVYVADPSLHKMNPCPRDLTAYLRAKYACVPGTSTCIRVHKGC